MWKKREKKEFHAIEEVTLIASMKYKLNVVNQWSETIVYYRKPI